MYNALFNTQRVGLFAVSTEQCLTRLLRVARSTSAQAKYSVRQFVDQRAALFSSALASYSAGSDCFLATALSLYTLLDRLNNT